MTTLLQHAADVAKLLEAGHGDLPVAYRHGASGDSGNIGSMHVTDRQDECGPFDLDAPEWSEGKPYISIYVGS